VKFTTVQTIAKKKKREKDKRAKLGKMNGFLSCPKSGSEKCIEEEGTSGEGRKRGFRALLYFFLVHPDKSGRKQKVFQNESMSI
jgi:hypothetical protein